MMNSTSPIHFSIEAVDSSTQEEMIHFLKRHDNSSLFLLGNFQTYGPTLTEAPYSGNFKLILSSEKIVGVLCLTKNGSLLIESEVGEPVYKLVLTTCLAESIQVTAVIGEWNFCHSYWEFLKRKNVIQNETIAEKEILYSVELSKIALSKVSEARLLTLPDYAQWKPLRMDYIKEMKFPINLNDDQLSKMYQDRVEKKLSWGYFQQDQLVSMADLNAMAFDLGQLGGVYTPPSHRRKGYSKFVIQQVLHDAKELHAIRKLVIFTGENNLPARQLYESLGVTHVGYFALLFGK